MGTYMHSSRYLRKPLLPLALAMGCASAPPAPLPPPTTAVPVQNAPVSTAAPMATDPNTMSPPSKSTAAQATAASFNWNAYNALRGTADNYVFSGHSLRQALTMAAMGARGHTRSEMDAVLGTGDDTSDAGATLRIANRIWADDHAQLRPEYTSLLRSRFGAGIETLPLMTASELSRGKINAWVKEETAGKIPELLPPKSITADTRLVLTNAVYFKSNWASEFAVAATKSEPFTDEQGKQTPAAMMHKDGTFRAAQIPDGMMVELAYKDSDLAMTLLVPNDTKGLARLESTLSADSFAKYTASLQHQRVSLALPKFKFRAGGVVNGGMQKLGIQAAFSDRADFGGMLQDGSAPLRIDSVFHDAFIAVDEAGTEAAAATAVVMGVRGMPLGKPLEIRADHAFLFAIRNVKSGAIYFLGRVGKPTPGPKATP